MKTGDILFCAGSKFLSKAIRFVTKSEWSHTALFIEIWGEPYIIDAQKNGINVKPFDKWKAEYNYKFIVMRNPNLGDEYEFSKKAMSKSGITLYDFESLLLRHPIELITGKWKLRPNEENRMYCSEYVAWSHNIDQWYRMNPQDVYEYAKINYTTI